MELHEKSKFEIYAYSFGSQQDRYTKRIKDAVSYFRDIKNLDYLEAVKLARNDHLDIAIDLNGYTENHRMPIFSYRVAPIQINFLGYEASTGSTEIDYIIADKIAIPDKFAKYYSEKIIYMPDSYMCFDDKREIPPNKFTRKEFDLPEDAFVMAAFHGSYKITAQVFDSWLRILSKIPNAILWISTSNEIANNNIKRVTKAKGIDLSRIVFAQRMPSDIDHLSRHYCADLFLDTFNFNACSTAIDSLWTGLPIVTLLGKSFLARTTASFLKTLGLENLIAHTIEDYEEIVKDLANNTTKLKEIKEILYSSKTGNALFDSTKSTRDLEKIYLKMVKSLKESS